MKLLIIITLILLAGCETPRAKQIREAQESEHHIKCFDVGSNRFLYRCENQEVICYKYNDGLQCKFKELK
jgi:hypothetical protein